MDQFPAIANILQVYQPVDILARRVGALIPPTVAIASVLVLTCCSSSWAVTNIGYLRPEVVDLILSCQVRDAINRVCTKVRAESQIPLH